MVRGISLGPSAVLSDPCSHHASDGPTDHAEEGEAEGVQVQARVQGRLGSHLAKLLHLQCNGGAYGERPTSALTKLYCLQNHPLRQCATRLKAKAEKLLKNITDRRERLDPPIPSDVSRGGTPKLNGNGLNGHAVVRSRSIAFTKSPSPSKPLGSTTATARRDAQFPDQPAIVRTAEGMAEWLHLDQELDARLNGELLANGFSGPSVEEKLLDFVGMVPDMRDEDAMSVDGEVGEKRKL